MLAHLCKSIFPNLDNFDWDNPDTEASGQAGARRLTLSQAEQIGEVKLARPRE